MTKQSSPFWLGLAGALGATCVFGALFYRFYFSPVGSVGAVREYFDGASLVASSPEIDLGSVPAGTTREVNGHVRNVTDEPIRILAVRTSCSCTTASSKFPLLVPAKEEAQIPFIIHNDVKTAGSFEYTAVVICDKGEVWPVFRIHVEVVGPIKAVAPKVGTTAVDSGKSPPAPRMSARARP